MIWNKCYDNKCPSRYRFYSRFRWQRNLRRMVCYGVATSNLSRCLYVLYC